MRKLLLLPLLGTLFMTSCMKEKTKLAKLQEKYDSLSLAYFSQSIDLRNCKERRPLIPFDDKIRVRIRGYGEDQPFGKTHHVDPVSGAVESTPNYDVFPRNPANGKIEIPYPGLTK